MPLSPTSPVDFDPQAAFNLSEPQHLAATARGMDVLVTAGAGSGKTRTLIARYISLLAEGQAPDRVLAITFTEKAAREMRSRARQFIGNQRSASLPPAQSLFWQGLEERLDSARIGTIHALCTEILRAHPVEASVDPQFSVLDEGLAAALRSETVENTLVWALEQNDLLPLFQIYTLDRLRALLLFALTRRLDLSDWLSNPPSAALPPLFRNSFTNFLTQEPVVFLLDELRAYSTSDLDREAGEGLADTLRLVVSAWEGLETAWQRVIYPDVPMNYATGTRLLN
jgi:hypothetical protein